MPNKKKTVRKPETAKPSKRQPRKSNMVALNTEDARTRSFPIVDITARKQAEMTLQESEERYRLIAQNAEDIIWTMNMERQLTYVSPSLERALGYPAGELMRLRPEQLVVSESLANGLKALREELASARAVPDAGYARVLEMEYRRKDGSTLWVEMKFSFFRNSNGQPSGILGAGRDITERKRAEEAEHKLALIERKRLEDEITVTKGRLETLVTSSTVMLYASQAFGDLDATYVSDNIGAIMGYTSQDFFSKGFWASHIHPEDMSKVFEELPKLFEHGYHKHEYRFMFKDGTYHWMQDELKLIRNESGNPFEIIGTWADITERKQAEKATQAQTRFLSLLNSITQAILSEQGFDKMAETITRDITALLEADSCYITRWDAVKEEVLPVATNNKANLFFLTAQYPKGEKNLTSLALEERRIIVVEDYASSPHANPKLVSKFSEKTFISIPLIYGEHKLGAAIIGFNETRQFTAEELECAKQAGSQIALAVWNKQQDFEIKKRLAEASTLAYIERALSETERVGIKTMLQLIVDSAKRLIPDTEQAVLHLIDHKQRLLIPQAIAGFEKSHKEKLNMRLGEGVAGQALAAEKTIIVSDVTTDARFLDQGMPVDFRSLMVTPIHAGKEQVGTISVQSSQPNVFTQDDDRLLSTLGTVAAIAIQNARLFETTQLGLKEINSLYQITRKLAGSLDTEQLMKDVVDLLQQNFGYYHVQIYVIDPQSGDLTVQQGSGEIGAQIKKRGGRLPAGAGIVSSVAESGMPFVTQNVEKVVFYIPDPFLPDTQSELAIPIKINEQILGVLDVQQSPPNQLNENDLKLVSAVADQLAIALEKARLYSDLETSLQQEKDIRSQLVQNERLAVMGRLLATVSHELNNPLQAIQNALFLLKKEEGISSQGHQDLNIVLTESERMTNLIERLRATYRPIQAEDFHQTQINDIIDDVYALIATHLRHKGIAFEFHPEPNLPVFPAFTDQIKQVMLNLMMNAVEAMTGGGVLNVSTQYLRERQEIWCAVSDTGPGISETILPHIFDAFITDKERGTGLGLTITYDIITKHRGRITAENNPAGGATFNVWLPLETRESL